MPRRFHYPPELAGRIFVGSRAIASGLLTWPQLRRHPWKRLFHDVYVDAYGPTHGNNLPLLHHGLRCQAAGLILPEHVAITGRSAAYLHGVELAAPDEPIEVLLQRPLTFGPYTGIKVYTTDCRNIGIVPGSLPQVVTTERAAIDIARGPNMIESVVYLDALAHQHMLNPARLHNLIMRTLSPQAGSARAIRALALMNGRSESPQESRLRVKLTLHGLEPPAILHEVRDQGSFVARVDLAWPQQRLALEYDGAWHGNSQQVEHDRRRLNQLVSHGWMVLHVTAERLRREFAQLCGEIQQVLSRAIPDK